MRAKCELNAAKRDRKLSDHNEVIGLNDDVVTVNRSALMSSSGTVSLAKRFLSTAFQACAGSAPTEHSQSTVDSRSQPLLDVMAASRSIMR